MVKSKQFIRPRLYGLPERVSPLLMADKSTLATPRTQGSIIVYYTLIHKHYYVNGEKMKSRTLHFVRLISNISIRAGTSIYMTTWKLEIMKKVEVLGTCITLYVHLNNTSNTYLMPTLHIKIDKWQTTIQKSVSTSIQNKVL